MVGCELRKDEGEQVGLHDGDPDGCDVGVLVGRLVGERLSIGIAVGIDDDSEEGITVWILDG